MDDHTQAIVALTAIQGAVVQELLSKGAIRLPGLLAALEKGASILLAHAAETGTDLNPAVEMIRAYAEGIKNNPAKPFVMPGLAPPGQKSIRPIS